MAAEQGLASANHSLDGKYGEDGRVRDNAEVRIWHIKDLERCRTTVLGRLKLTWYDFCGVARHFSEAAARVRRLAKQGDVAAQSVPGPIYENAQCYRKQDHDEAVKWNRMAGGRGLADAQAKLGLYYFLGYGVAAQDYAEAASSFGKAADEGSASGQGCVGVMCHASQGVPQDSLNAYTLYRLALEPGRDIATDFRGSMEVTIHVLASEMTESDIGRAR